MERDADFLHKKAERANLRVCLRDKYRLPKVSIPTFFYFYFGDLLKFDTDSLY